MNIDKARQQIRKLLALGNDDAATQAEAENALRFARRLMLQHNVSEDDIKAKDPHEIQADAERVEYGQDTAYSSAARSTQWESTLAYAICALVGTVKYYRESTFRKTSAGTLVYGLDAKPVPTTKFTYYGPLEDVRDAAALHEEWSVAIASLARMRFGGALRGPGRSYAEGFASALFNKARQLYQDEQLQIQAGNTANGCTALVVQNAHALMLAKVAKASQWLKNQGVHLVSSGGGRGGRHHGDAYSAGRADGQRAGFTRQQTRRLTQ